jgi:hypothetical protein
MDHARMLWHRIRISTGVHHSLAEAYADPVRAAWTTVAQILVAVPKKPKP